MSFNAPPSTGGSNYAPCPTGMHVARCYQLVDLGIQETTWNGTTKHLHKIRVAFELPNTLMTEGDRAGEPFSIAQIYTFSMAEKANLRKMIEGWRGQSFTDDEANAFNLEKIVDKPCMISVVHNTKGDKTYANIGSVNPLMEGMECPPMVNKSLIFNLATSTVEDANDLPDWLKDKINFQIPNYQALNAQQDRNEKAVFQQAAITSQGMGQNAHAPTSDRPIYFDKSKAPNTEAGEVVYDDDIPF